MSESLQNYSSQDWPRPSRYNIVADLGDSLALYNALTGARVMVRDEALFPIVRGLESENFELPRDLPSGVMELLARSGFLVSGNFDELAYVQRQVHTTGRNAAVRRVTVVLTKRCNLGCTYCFQAKDEPEDTDNYEAVRSFLESEIVPGGALQVTWFGGEPTLRMTAIRSLSESVIARCKQLGCSYRATISTNGVLLDDPERVRALRSAGVEQFQITLDGPEAVQERRRPSLTRKPTYGRILCAMQHVIDLGGSVVLKVIVDTDSATHVPALFEDLQRLGLLPRIRIAIQETESKFAAGEYGKRFEDEAAFARIKLELFAVMQRLGYPLNEPERKDEYCAATSPHTSIVDAGGALYRCGTERENYIGQVSGGAAVVQRSEYQATFVQETQLRLSDCRTCKVLPICGGGCTLGAQGLANRSVCSFYRYGIRGYLRLLEDQAKGAS